MKDFLLIAMPSPVGLKTLRFRENGYNDRVTMFNERSLLNILKVQERHSDSAMTVLWPSLQNKSTAPLYSSADKTRFRFHSTRHRDILLDKLNGLLFILNTRSLDNTIELTDDARKERRSFSRPQFGGKHNQTLQYEFPFAPSFLNQRQEGALAHLYGDGSRPGTSSLSVASEEEPSGELAAILNPLVLRLSLSGDELDFSRNDEIEASDVLRWLLEASTQPGGYLHVEPIAEPADDARCRALDVIAKRVSRSDSSAKPLDASVTEDLLLAQGDIPAAHPRWLPFFCLDCLGGRFQLSNAKSTRRWFPPQDGRALPPNAAWFARYWAGLWGDSFGAEEFAARAETASPPSFQPQEAGDPTRGRTAFAPFGPPVSEARFGEFFASCSATLAALGEAPVAGGDTAGRLLSQELLQVLRDIYDGVAGTEHDRVHQAAITSTTDRQPLVDVKLLLERIGRATFLPLSPVLVEPPALPLPTTADRVALWRALSEPDRNEGAAEEGQDGGADRSRLRWFDHAASMHWAGEAFLTSLVGNEGAGRLERDGASTIRLVPGWWRDWRDRLFAPGDARPFQLIPDGLFILGESKLSAAPEGETLGESGALRWTGGRVAFD